MHCWRGHAGVACRGGGGGSLHECAPAAASAPPAPTPWPPVLTPGRPAARQPRVPQRTITESQRGHGHALPRSYGGAAHAALAPGISVLRGPCPWLQLDIIKCGHWAALRDARTHTHKHTDTDTHSRAGRHAHCQPCCVISGTKYNNFKYEKIYTMSNIKRLPIKKNYKYETNNSIQIKIKRMKTFVWITLMNLN